MIKSLEHYLIAFKKILPDYINNIVSSKFKKQDNLKRIIKKWKNLNFFSVEYINNLLNSFQVRRNKSFSPRNQVENNISALETENLSK